MMNKYQNLIEFLYEEAEGLEKEASLKEADKKYSEDLGLWAIKHNKLEKIKKELEHLVVEIGHYHDEEDQEKKPTTIDSEEFPTLSRELIELEIRTDKKSKKHVIDILNNNEAIELEKYHIANLTERARRVNSALSSLAKKRLFVKNKDANPWSKDNIVKILEHIGATDIKTTDKGKGKTEYQFDLDGIPLFGTSSEELGHAVVSYKKTKGD